MIFLLAAALLGASPTIMPADDPQARQVVDRCVTATVRQFGEAPPTRGALHTVTVRRAEAEWRVDYDITLQDRAGRSQQWVGRCTLAAPLQTRVASY